MAQKNIAYLLEGQGHKQGGLRMDGTGRYGKYHKKKKTAMDGTRGEDEVRKTDCTGHGLESGKEAKKRPTAKELAENYRPT